MTDPGKGARGASTFIVEKGTPGFDFGKKEDKLGIRSSTTRELIFTDCKIPRGNIITREGMGFIIAMKTFDQSRPAVGAQAVGVAQAALEEALNYSKVRKQFGNTISSFQAIQHMLADMATYVEAARALIYHTAKVIDSGEKNIGRLSAMSKLFASDMAMKVTIDAVQILGGYGYMKDYPSKQFDSSALTIPHFDVGGDPSNLQYRLLQPPMPNDKYRYHQGLKHPLWLAEPDKELTGICVLCEGMKKGALVFIRFVVEPNNQQYRVVSLPSKAPAKSLYPRLSEFEKIYLVMDPDAHHFSRDNKGKVVLPSIYNMVENIEGPSVNVVTLPHKADDFFTMYGGNDRDFMQFLNHSREVKQSTH